MKPYLLAGTAFLALAASGSAAHAQRVNFTYTGSLVTFTVRKTAPTRSSPLARRAETAFGCLLVFSVPAVAVPRSAATSS